MRWPWSRKPDPEPVTLDVRELVAFMRSRVSWSDWCRMDEASRVAFSMAGDIIDTERAAKIVRLAREGDVGLARMLAHIDGGDALRAAMVRREADTRKVAGGVA